MLDSDKRKKIGDSEDKLSKLDDKIGDLNLKGERASKKLSELKGCIDQAKLTAWDHPEVLERIKLQELEAEEIVRDSDDIDKMIGDLKGKREELKKLVDDIISDQSKSTSKKINEILKILQEQMELAQKLDEELIA